VTERYVEGGVVLTIAGPVATLTLDRADVLNAQTPHTWEALREIGRSIAADVRVVVIRSNGRAFSAGLDRRMLSPEGVPGTLSVAELAGMPTADADAVLDRYQQAFSWLRRPDLVSVAAVRGHAIGAGLQLALACDVRILADDALLCMAETTLGLVPDLGGTKALVSLIGPSRALEMCLTGRRVAAAQAGDIGLANLVVPPADLDSAVDDLVSALLAPPRAAVTETKALILAAADRTPAEAAAAERTAQLRRIRDLSRAPES
jgi:enoyl-CoA hydratase/carnithine racemase